MKLKYYLRGLAVGVILTTIILSIANADNKPMTDAQVRQRALELGMVESDSRKLTDIQWSNEDSETDKEEEDYNPSIAIVETGEIDSEQATTESESASTESATAESTKDSKESADATGADASKESADASVEESSTTGTSEGTASASRPPASTDGAASPSVPPVSESADSEAPVALTIKSGDSSYTVSKALAAAGLVEDAVDFDNYLCNYGYSRKIRTGTYEITPGMSYEEIARMIAG